MLEADHVVSYFTPATRAASDAEDQHAVEELAAQGIDKALADRIHARRLDGGAQDPGPGGLDDGGAQDEVRFDPR